VSCCPSLPFRLPTPYPPTSLLTNFHFLPLILPLTPHDLLSPFALRPLGSSHNTSEHKLISRTLSPTWNENFEAMIPSRVSAKFNFEVQDWNTVGSSTDLGGGQIDLTSLEPFESQELTIPIVHPEKGEKGHLDVRLLFQPESMSSLAPSLRQKVNMGGS
jgi:hypothetical protein